MRELINVYRWYLQDKSQLQLDCLALAVALLGFVLFSALLLGLMG